jgi:integrase
VNQLGLAEFVSARSRRSVNTAELYESAVNQFAKCLDLASPEAVITAIQNKSLEPIEALDKFVAKLSASNKAPNTICQYATATKSFLRFHGIKLDTEELKARLILPQKHLVSIDRAFEDSEIRALLDSAKDRGKALLLLMISTGARIDEISQLRLSNLDLGSDPPKVSFGAAITKTKKPRTNFLTKECASFLKWWLGKRLDDKNQWLFASSENPEVADTTLALSWVIRRLIMKCGLMKKLDSLSRRYQVHPHCIRKTFYSKCLAAGVQANIAELWLGHNVGLDANYLRPNGETLIVEWRKVEPHLTFLSEWINPSNAVPDKIKELERIIKRQKTENKSLRNDLDEMKSIYIPKIKEIEARLSSGTFEETKNGKIIIHPKNKTKSILLRSRS